MLAAFPFGGNAFAETKTFIKDYTYQAGELDSKESCRLLARAQVERLLYEELGSCLAEHTSVICCQYNPFSNQKVRKNRMNHNFFHFLSLQRRLG